jgi:1-aminocyclopropane-1-carboxylate deaminase/D-cysteine desulfhydrase-like pyridoxal-dependent ACC family enzyme
VEAKELRERLAGWPRLTYGSYPTPLEPLAATSAELKGPRLWIKRDDGCGPAMGGNKARKLEFLMAEVVQGNKRQVITYGGLQSNHARMVAAACAALGLEAHLFFFARRPAALEGNLLLDALLGARLHFIPFGSGGGGMTIERTNALVRLMATALVGPGAYFMPVGGHTVTGCLGYVAAAVELVEQIADRGLAPERTTVVTAAGTGGTLAGLLAGLALLESPVRALGIDVGKLWKGFTDSLAGLAEGICGRLGAPRRFPAAGVPLIESRYAGPGYGIMTPEVAAGLARLARREGVLLDPVYTGKAWAGLQDLIRQGYFDQRDEVIFLHTGGAPGLWAYEEELTGQGKSDQAGAER